MLIGSKKGAAELFEVFREVEFSAAHSLRGYRGRCENLHGHNWKVRVHVKARELNPLGMVMDFGEIEEALNAILAKLDHQNLNETSPFVTTNPTSENIAKYIFREASKIIDTDNLRVDRVMIWEKDNSCAVYEADQNVKSK